MKPLRPFALLVTLCLPPALGGTVKKVVETFDEVPWPAARSSRAVGTTSISTEAAPGLGSRGSLELVVEFSGKGFEWSGVDAPGGLRIPGNVSTITLRCRRSDKRYAFFMKFADGWGRATLGQEKLEWAIPADAPGVWRAATFQVPAHWVRPITITGFGTHNWSAQDAKESVRFWVDHIEVESDITQVDPKTGVLRTWKPNPDEKDPAKKAPPATPLLTFAVTTPVEANVFSRGKPEARVHVRNWRPGALSGKVAWRLLDDAGEQAANGELPVSVASLASLRLPLAVERFGRYALEATLSLKGLPPRTQRLVLARIPPYRELTEAQKLASPYGVNVHGGSERLVIEPFRKAGIVWFRDYAFHFPTLLKAKGADRRYNGWPWYPQLIQRYADAGVKLLPCSQKAIRAPEVKDGKVVGPVGPDRAWIREIADFLGAFPQITHWELGNEYDLNQENARAEELCAWRNYRAYHRTFAEVLDLLGAGEVTAVEQGRAGIWPERVRQCVASGDFAKVAVVNSHHYCGVSAPELDFGQLSPDVDQPEHRRPALFFDRLRAVKRAAQADGEPRQSWLTEVGWDTLAGKVVSPYEQAVYLARGWMLAMAAGTDKCFWFYDYDAAKPTRFFDGCGLLDAKGQPKLSLCALAGLTSVLPAPRFVGTLNAGEDTWGCVFESEGKLVAALWAIEGDEGPEVTLQAERLHDFLGNPLDGTTVRLSRAPVYAVGLDRGSPWFRQTAYSLTTPYLVVASAGDPVRPLVRVRNDRGTPIRCTVQAALPEGWQADTPQASATVEPGEAADLPLALTVGPDTAQGIETVRLTVSEDAVVKAIPLKVLVTAPLAVMVPALKGEPGRATLPVKVRNVSAGALDAVLRLRLPASWKAITPELRVAGLQPGETRELSCELEWSTDWKRGERATLEIELPGKALLRAPIAPPRLRLHRARGLKIDGRLDDWPQEAELPAWVLASTIDAAKARVFLGWAPEGLYGAVAVRDSKLQVSDPRSFWAGDCLELFVDTRDDANAARSPRHRFFEPGDHQFWLVPLADEGRVYVGQWKRKDEIPATRYDIPGVRSAARRDGDGYVMEFLLPASLLHGYRPQAGARLGLNVNLTVKGRRLDREVYWPKRKDWAVMNLPKTWGTLELAD